MVPSGGGADSTAGPWGPPRDGRVLTLSLAPQGSFWMGSGAWCPPTSWISSRTMSLDWPARWVTTRIRTSSTTQASAQRGRTFWTKAIGLPVALDKDIKGNDSKIYSLEHCCFVTNEDNIKESRIRNGSVGFCSESKPIVGIHKITGEVVRFKGGREAQRELGISQSSIGACCRKENKYKSAGGYYWYFAEEYDKLHK